MSGSAIEHCIVFFQTSVRAEFSNLTAGVAIREHKSLPLQYSLTAYARTATPPLTAGNGFSVTAPSCIIQSSSCNSSLRMPHLPMWLLFTIFIVLGLGDQARLCSGEEQCVFFY